MIRIVNTANSNQSFFFENYNLLLACQFALTFQSLRDWQSFSQNCSSALNKTTMIFDKSVPIDVQRSCLQQKTDSIKIRQELRAKMKFLPNIQSFRCTKVLNFNFYDLVLPK